MDQFVGDKLKGRTDQMPFKERLVDRPVEDGGRMFLVPEVSRNRVIRTASLKYNLSGHPKLKNLEPVERMVAVKKLYDELRENYGIRVPASFVIGRSEAKLPEDVFVVTDKIEGTGLDVVEAFEKMGEAAVPESERSQLKKESLERIIGLTNYFADKCVSGEPFLWDVAAARQYMWGNKMGEKEKHLYMIDTDVCYVSDDKKIALRNLVRLAADLYREKFEYRGLDVAGVVNKLKIVVDKISAEFKDSADPNLGNEKKNLDDIKATLAKFEGLK